MLSIGKHEYRAEIRHPEECDRLGFPLRISLGKAGDGDGGFREYAPHNIAFAREISGKVMCSCCGRQLKREYLSKESWRFCPRCGAEIGGRIGGDD